MSNNVATVVNQAKRLSQVLLQRSVTVSLFEFDLPTVAKITDENKTRRSLDRRYKRANVTVQESEIGRAHPVLRLDFPSSVQPVAVLFPKVDSRVRLAEAQLVCQPVRRAP